jgi:hypothetical protein
MYEQEYGDEASIVLSPGWVFPNPTPDNIKKHTKYRQTEKENNKEKPITSHTQDLMKQ